MSSEAQKEHKKTKRLSNAPKGPLVRPVSFKRLPKGLLLSKGASKRHEKGHRDAFESPEQLLSRLRCLQKAQNIHPRSSKGYLQKHNVPSKGPSVEIFPEHPLGCRVLVYPPSPPLIHRKMLHRRNFGTLCSRSPTSSGGRPSPTTYTYMCLSRVNINRTAPTRTRVRGIAAVLAHLARGGRNLKHLFRF